MSPPGGQRGTEIEVAFNGARLTDIKEIVFYAPGITVTSLAAASDAQVKAKLKIDPNARLGEYPLRLRTATGLSEMRTFYVGPYPSINEKENNGEFASAQKIPSRVTVTGVIDNEDVDYFLVEAKKGERLSVEVEGIRLGQTLFDPYIAILDMKRYELAAVDDSALALQDGYASILAPADGTYVIQVRESAYGGNGACVYRLHVGDFPRPGAVYPAGGPASQTIDAQFLGDPKGPIVAKIALPAVTTDNFPVFCQEAGQVAPSPNRMRVSSLPNAMEVEPNNLFADIKTSVPAAPVALNGVIATPKDEDAFKVPMKKGQVFDIHVYARRLRSGLDPVLTIHDAKGTPIVSNDDAVGPDSYIRFTVPADGDYFVRVYDMLNKGRADYVYRIEIAPVEATLTLAIPQVSQSSQERQVVTVPRGGRFATLVSANRANFGGELVLSADNLPKGVTLAAENMQANLGVMPVVFEAAADAPVAGSLVDLKARHADPKVNVSGRLEQKIDLVTGPPNITVYYQATVDRLAVAVAKEAPYKIQVIPPKVPLVQDGSIELKVVAERKAGFKGPIYLYMPFLPPGVGSAASVTIPEGQTQALYPINANSGGQVRAWKMYVLALADAGKGPVWTSSQLFDLSIAPPIIGLQLQMAATEQGKPTEVVGKLQVNTPFAGKATVKLVGLPAKVASKDLEITKDSKEVVFPVTVDATSPPGQHKTLFCQAIVTKDGEPILHNLSYGGTLRIDPPPPKPAAPVAQAPKAEPPKPTEKRLTRLEMLRLEYAQRRKAEKGQ